MRRAGWNTFAAACGGNYIQEALKARAFDMKRGAATGCCLRLAPGKSGYKIDGWENVFKETMSTGAGEKKKNKNKNKDGHLTLLWV